MRLGEKPGMILAKGARQEGMYLVPRVIDQIPADAQSAKALEARLAEEATYSGVSPLPEGAATRSGVQASEAVRGVTPLELRKFARVSLDKA